MAANLCFRIPVLLKLFVVAALAAAGIIIYFLAAMSPEQETRHSLLEKQLIIKLET